MKSISYGLLFSVLAFGLKPGYAQQPGNGQVMPTNWKFQTGNNPEWKKPGFNDAQWSAIKVPANWENEAHPDYDGYAWYRAKVKIPSSLKNKSKAGIAIELGAIDDRDSTFLNGKLVGSGNNWIEPRVYFLSFDNPAIQWDKENVIAIQVFDNSGPGGIWTKAPLIRAVDYIDFVKFDLTTSPIRWVTDSTFTKKITLRTTEQFNISGKLEISIINNLTSAVVKKQTVPASFSDQKPFVYEVSGSTSGGVSCRIACKFTDARVNKSTEAYAGIPYILTPPAPAKPQINGAKVYGVRPGSPVIYRIPVTGERPMKLSVDQLPEGLKFDAQKGIITGSIAQAGTYTVKLHAENTKGADTREFRFIVGSTLALTPPMGWNSWNCFGLTVSDKNIRATADAFVREGLVDYGWTYVNIDDGWEAPQRDKDGSILANEKFPDMHKLTAYVHDLGLKIGLYSSPGDYTCGHYLGSYQHEQQDAATWAGWGFDYIKYDWCGYSNVKPNPTLEELKEPYRMFGDILGTQSRDIVYSLCQYGMGDVWKWGGEVKGNLWRTTGDITDTWESLSGIGFTQADKSIHAKPGNWNDPDMLIVGRVGWGDLRPTRLTPDEQYTHISLWSLLAAPLLIGCDMEHLDAFTKSLLCNREVIDINQDPLGKAAQRVRTEGDLQIWIKPLEDGSVAVGMFNLSDKTMKDATFTWDSLEGAGKQAVRDVWRQTNLGEFESSYTTTLPPHGSVLLKLSR